ncbi:Dihydroxy-acid dehydratase [Oligella ureolytica]|uniref:L-arabinonate dehydratase n=1 Tax=Oligella ureolytica TaxID=90244 RepID=UPI000E03D9BC|nr:L-arabinonate dehydratase [Oligella ureolytica]SUA55257.1 Dihydroxy-acid dehydratase [Oligella ureolytica]
MTKERRPLRSERWMGKDDLRSFGHRSRMMQMGYDPSDWSGKPIIAIINTWSDLNPCHAHFKQRVEDVKRGVLQAGGFPVELPAISVSESFVKPTTMLYRNFLAMETEELIRSHPVDGAVLMGGCDKTTPGLLMGAISADLPAIFIPAGPMLRGNWKGQTLGSGSDAWRLWDERQAGQLSQTQWLEVETGIARSHGTCMTMGTASTMTSIAEVLGMCLSGASSIPAPDANHPRMAAASGRRIVEMVHGDLKPSDILSDDSFQNAVKVAMALGCSTNAVVHLLAMAHRCGLPLDLSDFDQASREIPVIANIRPSGTTYLMEDFYYAGGLPALIKRLHDKLCLTAKNVEGKDLGSVTIGAEVYNDDVIRPLSNPLYHEGALAVLRGNIAPNGCVIKPSAAESRLHQHTGPALVFDDYPSLLEAVENEDLDVTADHILILRNAGPQGGPGMPEWGMLPIPKKLLKAGVRDMLRLSDARMSGTSYGSCILHVSPESHIGGPLALVKTGDVISVDVPNRSIHLHVSEQELDERKNHWQQPKPKYERGYGWLYVKHIEQAHLGCDFDFLKPDFGEAVPEPDIF